MARKSLIEDMKPDVLESLQKDLKEYGKRVAGMSREQVEKILPTNRARRLHLWLKVHGNVDPEVLALEDVEDVEAEPAAEPGVDVQHMDDGILVEAKGRLDPNADGQGLVMNLEELMRAARIDPAVWTTDSFQTKTWATPMRPRKVDAKGRRMSDEVVIIRSWYVSAKFRRRLDSLATAADWSKPVRRVRPATMGRDSVPIAMIFPDMQVGYQWADRHKRLEPLHDWAAIDVALQLMDKVQPQVVQHLGDIGDLAEFSTKYPVPLELRDTTKPSLRTIHAILLAQREALPSADINLQGGNHDERPKNALIGTAYDGLTRADDPDGPPILSFASLLGLENLDVTWQNYKEDRWLWDTLQIQHGEIVRSRGGQTVAAVLQDTMHSVIFGHVHRRESASKTIHGPRGPKTITVATPGCLCRIDGKVPGVSKRPDWQQGVGLVYFDEERQQEHIEIIPIHSGVLYWKGERLEGNGQYLSREIADRIGYPQIVVP